MTEEYKKLYKRHLNVQLDVDLMVENNKNIVTDEATLFLNNNKKIKFIKGEEENIKITKKSDLNKSSIKTFYGIGFDVHRLVPKRKLYLAGLRIKYLFYDSISFIRIITIRNEAMCFRHIIN